MERKLTEHASVTYPLNRNTMDETQLLAETTNEVPTQRTKEDDEKDSIKLLGVLNEKQEKAATAWKKVLIEKNNKGEKLTQEETELVKRSIEKGELPNFISGGSGDGKFEFFPAEKYVNTSLEDLAKRVKSAGGNNQITQELMDDFNNELATMVGLGRITDREQDAFMKDIGEINQSEARQQSQATPDNSDTSDAKKIALDQKIDAFGKRKEMSGLPRSIQEVATSIIFDEGKDRWGIGGTFPLLDSDNNLNQANFVRWFRERMLYHHTSNSRDYQLQLGNLVGITNQFGSTTSIFSMDKDRGQYFLDDKSGNVLDTLAGQLKMELWLFGNMRNHDLLYQEYMGSDSELPKFFAQVHGKEEIIQADSLRTIMTMSKDFNPEGGDTSVGDAIRKAYEIYFYASDLPELKKLLGEDSIFFKKEGFINAFKIIDKKEGTDNTIEQDSQKFIDKIFTGDKLNEAAFISEMNPFNNQNKPEFNKKIMREMVRQAIAKKYDLEYGLDKDIKERVVNGKVRAPEREFLRKDLEYAEDWAWILTRWTGAAARNDTDAVGFDAQTKLIKFRDYRERQSSETRAGQFGNEYDLPVLKSLMSDFFNGITVEKRVGETANVTPFELFRMLDDIEDKNLTKEEEAIEKKKITDRFNFEQFTQKAFLANHINRAFEVFHSTMGAEEMRLEEIVKWDPFRGVILDRGKFEEQIKEKFLKPLRYEFSTYAQLDFGKLTKVQDGKVVAGQTPKYKVVTNAEKFFGPEVLHDLRPMADEYYKKKLGKKSLTAEEKVAGWSAYLSDNQKDGGRSLLWKRAAMAKMASHIKSHRQFGNGYTPFSAGMVETLYEALETIKAVDIDDGDEETGLSYGKRFLSHHDIEWIKKHSDTTAKDLFIKDFLIKGVGIGAGKGIWEGAGVFVREIFK